ncbi:MAG TPA: hypothetical protein VHP14_16555, partial [Anaerolineales bacterium]|nr:hypothetical protein [Anaerolineales bacterium]
MSVKIPPMSQHNPTFVSHLTSCFLLFVFLSSCSFQPATSPPASTATSPATMEVPPTDPAVSAVPTEPPTVVSTLPPAVERPRYVLDLQLSYSSKAATVDETIIYPNLTGETLTNLVLAVEPNLWSGGFSLKSIAVDDQPVSNYTIENMNQKLEIQLPQPMPPSATIKINLIYGLILPQMQAYI